MLNLTRAFYVVVGLALLSLAALGYEYFNMRQNAIRINEATRIMIRDQQLAVQLRSSTDDLTTMARSYAATGLKKFKDHYEAIVAIREGKQERPEEYYNTYWDYLNADKPVPNPALAPARAFIDIIKDPTSGFTNEEEKLAEKVLEESGNLSVFEREAFKLAEAGNHAAAIERLFNPEYFEHKYHIMDTIHKFNDAVRERAEKNEADSLRAQRRSQVMFLFIFISSLILMGVAATLNVIEQRRALAASAAEHRKAAEENEQLNNSVINILQAVNQLSQRDLTARAPVTEDVIGTVSDSINALTDETARVLSGVTDIAGQVAEVSNTVKARAEEVTRVAMAGRTGLDQMMEALLEATQATNQVAALAEQSNEFTTEATDVIDTSLNTVTETVRDMESIRETIAETEKRIKRLGERSQEISGIVNLINTIAERTHVLALNASMQAAVAGEAGRGFAVVAEEVQRLAESARNATEQIGTLVNNIQVETNETINTVNRTIEQVVVGSEQAQKAGEQMRRTQEITAQLVQQVHSIAGAAEQQKTMSGLLLEAVQNVTQTNQDAAEQIQAQNKETDSLIEAARQLVDSVSVFKLPQAA